MFDISERVCPGPVGVKVIGKENTESLDPPVINDQRIPGRLELATDIAGVAVILRYGRLVNKVDSKEWRYNVRRLVTVLIELESVSVIACR